MTLVSTSCKSDLLTGWLDRQHSCRPTRRCTPARTGGTRFAFYGRMSTDDFQDVASSRSWQRTAAEDLITGHGQIVVEYFDVACSRRRPWRERTQAAALLAALADPRRGFDAVVVGEYEPAFHARQLQQLIPSLAANGVGLWLPETAGPLNPDDPTHRALMLLLGAQAKRAVLRARFRTTAAMQAQTREQGRYLGGRPPYGYRLVDAGPHPNAAHARWGRRRHRLDPDPATAPHVKWIFAQRLAGNSVASIARALNEANVACPSSVDPDRNPHRNGSGWCLRTVAAILANPRYTGYQVWNRQRHDHHDDSSDLISADDVPESSRVQRWNSTQHWVLSAQPAHPALVSQEDFITAQAVTALPLPRDGTSRVYLLTGLLRCTVCRRRLEAHWLRGRPGYRCRHGSTSAKPNIGRPTGLYLREDHALARIHAHLLRHDHGEYQPSDHDPGTLVAYLRDRNITIDYDGRICTLNPDEEGQLALTYRTAA